MPLAESRHESIEVGLRAGTAVKQDDRRFRPVGPGSYVEVSQPDPSVEKAVGFDRTDFDRGARGRRRIRADAPDNVRNPQQDQIDRDDDEKAPGASSFRPGGIAIRYEATSFQ